MKKITCKHDWHFVDGTDRLRCSRCGLETGPRTPDQLMQDLLSDVATMGSAWSQDGKRIDPLDVYAVPTGQLAGYKLRDLQPTNSIQFFNNVSDGPSVEVLRISKDGIWVNPDVPAEEAAKKVLEALDHNIKFMVQTAVQAEREACAKLMESQWDWVSKNAAAAAIRARGQE